MVALSSIILHPFSRMHSCCNFISSDSLVQMSNFRTGSYSFMFVFIFSVRWEGFLHLPMNYRVWCFQWHEHDNLKKHFVNSTFCASVAFWLWEQIAHGTAIQPYAVTNVLNENQFVTSHHKYKCSHVIVLMWYTFMSLMAKWQQRIWN